MTPYSTRMLLADHAMRRMEPIDRQRYIDRLKRRCIIVAVGVAVAGVAVFVMHVALMVVA